MDLSENLLVCCLCNFKGLSESDLENHIDSNHADIFKFSTTTQQNDSKYNQVRGSSLMTSFKYGETMYEGPSKTEI